MINEHTCFICVGSNYNASNSLHIACDTLEAALGSITWAEATVTEAVGHPSWPQFTNRCGMFTTTMPEQLIKMQLKGIEGMCGRNEHDDDSKKNGQIVIDIDLIMFDGEVLKPKDIECEYIKLGAEQLNVRLG